MPLGTLGWWKNQTQAAFVEEIPTMRASDAKIPPQLKRSDFSFFI
jgi:hypothetical protein